MNRLLYALYCTAVTVSAFTAPRQRHPFLTMSLISLDAASATSDGDTMSLSLAKPLGIILEEMEEGKSSGVFVKEVNEGGSAFQYADLIRGCKLSAVQGQDVTQSSFDSVMDKIINAPATVELQVLVNKAKAEIETEAVDSKPSPASLEVGTPVTIVFQQPGSPDVQITAKVGDNLRTTLLDNGIELYQGLKQKLGNCGGGGQCTFCAVDLVQDDGWLERSEYEDNKLTRLGSKARLACLNNIQGPATLQKTSR